jgi:diadenylate cyclase
MPTMRTPSFVSLPEFTLIALIDILAVAFLFYQFFTIIRGRRAVPIITGVAMLIVTYLFAVITGMSLLRTILENVAPYSVFALIVMFQSDIRRLLARMGQRRFLTGQTLDRRAVVEEVLITLESLTKARTGALIVLERDIGLRTFVESGVRIDGVISRDLLLSIFHPGNAMHDGAVIIQGDRITAAACFLPLSMNPRIMSTVGTRHRAGIGVTEEADCLTLIASEETGGLSVASFGEIQAGLSIEQVEDRIDQHFGLDKKGRLTPAGGTAVPSMGADGGEWRGADRS